MLFDRFSMDQNFSLILKYIYKTQLLRKCISELNLFYLEETSHDLKPVGDVVKSYFSNRSWLMWVQLDSNIISNYLQHVAEGFVPSRSLNFTLVDEEHVSMWL